MPSTWVRMLALRYFGTKACLRVVEVEAVADDSFADGCGPFLSPGQSQSFLERLGVVAISTGDIFRANVKGQTTVSPFLRSKLLL